MSTSSKRKPRAKKYASELSIKTARNMKRALVNEIAANAAAQYDRARSELVNAERRKRNQERNRRNSMVAKGLVPRLRAAMHSWGLDLNLSIIPSRVPSAWTDFESITVCHDDRLTRAVSEVEGEETEPISETELRHIAAETRGMFYHEVGHNLFSVRLEDLLTAAWAEGFTPAEDDARVVLMDETLPGQWSINRSLRFAWNALEDQRMEAALVEESPQIAAYLTIMSLRLILSGGRTGSSWVLTAGRSYLPADLRESSKVLWGTADSQHSAEYVEDVVQRYVLADNARAMAECVVEMRAILEGLGVANPTGTQPHEKWGAPDPSKPADGPQSGGDKTEQTNEKIQRTSEKNKSAAERQDSDASEQPSKSGDQPSEDEQPSKGGAPSGGGEPTPSGDEVYPWEARDRLTEGLNEALDKLGEDETLTDDVSAMNDAHASDEGALPLYTNQRPNKDADSISKAHAIVDDIERAFLLATEDCAPRWESGQRRGVLDVLRYSTRQPGDVEIFRNYSDHGDPASAIDVSLFLDISGSMMGTGDALGAAAWAVKVACGRLGIGCDVALFNESGHQLWGVDEQPAYLPRVDAGGGTNPSGAFDGLLTEERERRTHLVLVMTDGAWSSGVTMAPWKKDNMHSVLFYYTNDPSTQMDVDPRMADQKCCDEAFVIGNLMDIPVALENILINLA